MGVVKTPITIQVYPPSQPMGFLSLPSGLYLYMYKIMKPLTLWDNSADNKLMIFFYFAQKIGFDSSCNVSPKETVCMKCLIPKFLPIMLSIK